MCTCWTLNAHLRYKFELDSMKIDPIITIIITIIIRTRSVCKMFSRLLIRRLWNENQPQIHSHLQGVEKSINAQTLHYGFCKQSERAKDSSKSTVAALHLSYHILWSSVHSAVIGRIFFSVFFFIVVLILVTYGLLVYLIVGKKLGSLLAIEELNELLTHTLIHLQVDRIIS